MNLEVVARTVIKATLEANANYATLLTWPGTGLIRTFGQFVHAEVPLPYVTVEWYAGGMDNDAKTQASKSMWKVAGHTQENEPLIYQIQAAIDEALNHVWPTMGSITGYAGYDPIRLAYPYSDTVIRQGRSILRAGGIYTLCLAETY